MRKLSQLLLSIIFMIPMLFGGMSMLGVFSNASNSLLVTLNGGGGGNSLDDPSAGKKTPENTQKTTYTFKTYEDYFIDYFNLPAESYTRDETTGVVTIDYTKITRKTVNGETELSYNGNVFYVVTSDDLTGTGSETDPYVVHSTKGFLYLTNTSLSKVAIGSTYFELENDVILNNETFDKDGNPSGGDGYVYEWERVVATIKSFDGKGNAIHGLYINDKNSAQTVASLFSSCYIVKNINVFDFYLYGNEYVSPIIYKVLELAENIITKGYICGDTLKGRIGGVAAVNSGIIKNCKSWTEIIDGYICGGIASATSRKYLASVKQIELIGCKNYGNVTSTWTMAGILALPTNTEPVSIKLCENYGMFQDSKPSNTCNIGGIFGFSVGGDSKIVINDCKNYGSTKEINSGGCGGIFEGLLSIDGFENYGNMYCGLINTIRGEVCDVVVNIKNVKHMSKKGSPLFAYRDTTGNTKVIFNLNKILVDYTNSTQQPESVIIRRTSYNEQKTILNVSNLNIIDNSANTGFSLFNVTAKNTIINIKNCNVNVNCRTWVIKTSFICRAVIPDGVEINVDGLVANIFVNNEKKSFYYGANFSGFYVSWRTGKVGLVALDGRGQFQGAVTEEWLINKGYAKKTI